MSTIYGFFQIINIVSSQVVEECGINVCVCIDTKTEEKEGLGCFVILVSRSSVGYHNTDKTKLLSVSVNLFK